MGGAARPVRLLRLGGLDPIETQAVYHALAERLDEAAEDTVVLTRPTAPCACLGYHQIADHVLDRDAARALGVPIVRRRVGGGMTYLDPDQVFYQFVFHHTRVPVAPSQLYAQQLAAPVAALRALGVDAALVRTCEIEVGGRRIAGVGAARIGEASVVVGNVLLDFSYRDMTALWKAPSRAFRRLAAEALEERVTTLRREDVAAGPEAVEDALVVALARSLGRPLVEGELRDEERAALREQARALTDEGFLDLHAGERRGTAPPLKISARAFVHAVEQRTEGVVVRGALLACDDRIVRGYLESDPDRDWREVEARLGGLEVARWSEACRRRRSTRRDT